MTHFRSRVAFLSAVVLLWQTQPAAAQVTIYNSNGFEPGTFNVGSIVGQQGFASEPAGNTAGQIQTGAALNGSQSFQVVGANIVTNPAFNEQNFWFRSYPINSVNPVGSGTPFVQVRGNVRMSGLTPLPNDIPFVGFHLEGFSSIGLQQAISPIFFSADGFVRVFTTGGTVLQSTTTFNREQWYSVLTELDFASQTFKVYLDNNPTPLTFGSVQAVPFRNTFGTTTSLAETGFLATFNTFTGGGTLNNFFVDDHSVTRSATSLAPVPEPAACLLVGLAAAGVSRLRRRPAAA